MLAIIHPSGKVSYSIERKKPLERVPETVAPPEGHRRDVLCHLKHAGFEATREYYESHPPSPYGLVPGSESAKTDREHHKSPRLGLTRKGQNRLREGASALEIRYGSRGRLAFDTLTFPPEFDQEHNAERLSATIKHFLNSIRHYYLKAGVPFLYQYVIEIHPNRSQDLPIPHIHVLRLSGAKAWHWIISKEALNTIWKRSVLKFYPNNCDSVPNFRPSTRTEFVKKSVGGYMAKYLSKSGTDCQLGKGFSELLSLGQWWGQSPLLLKLLKGFTHRFRGWQADYLIELFAEKEGFSHCKIELDYDGRKICVGGVYYPKSKADIEFSRRISHEQLAIKKAGK